MVMSKEDAHRSIETAESSEMCFQPRCRDCKDYYERRHDKTTMKKIMLGLASGFYLGTGITDFLWYDFLCVRVSESN